MTAAAHSDRLQRIVKALEAGDLLSSAEQRAAAEDLRELMLPPSRYAERDAFLFSNLRQRFFAERTVNDAAKEIAAGLNRYFTTSWPRDRLSPECPERIAGTLKGAYWQLLKAVERPLSAERIRKILGHFEMTNSF